MNPAGGIGQEPKDGDFVAYLAQIEHRQVRTLQAAPAHAPPGLGAPAQPGARSGPLDRTQAEALIEALRQKATRATGLSPQQFLGALVLAFGGLVFILAGLSARDGAVPIVIGAFLCFLAWRRLRRLMAGGSATGDLAERLKGKS